jgi:hypothetical protein
MGIHKFINTLFRCHNEALVFKKIPMHVYIGPLTEVFETSFEKQVLGLHYLYKV